MLPYQDFLCLKMLIRRKITKQLVWLQRNLFCLFNLNLCIIYELLPKRALEIIAQNLHWKMSDWIIYANAAAYIKRGSTTSNKGLKLKHATRINRVHLRDFFYIFGRLHKYHSCVPPRGSSNPIYSRELCRVIEDDISIKNK